MRGMAFGHMSGILALVSLALGYIVCSLAQKEKGLLKTVGYIIGTVVIVISSLIVLVKVLVTVKLYMKMCPISGSVIEPMKVPDHPRK